MKRSPIRRKPTKGIPTKVRAEVARRSGGRCEIAHTGCSGRAQHMHHRLMRSHGGKHEPSNLLHVCHDIHVHIHANPKLSYHMGWLIRSGGES